MFEISLIMISRYISLRHITLTGENMTTKKTNTPSPTQSPSKPHQPSRTTTIDTNRSRQINSNNKGGLSFSVKPAQPITTGSGKTKK
ncbi:hypothetical protein GCM10008066_24300 [Oxalicibacterium faecigallinarum]|uniref:Uncharacterized protein n=1 Tax=Oxalicibacterium faecigallinarum TaxID=573741 RepID=A0A8J3AW68_9BURK|nr:hypothetical protein GCM10008066_24300 [Oxalicibacterium faecigallinarum]